jgi:hypothetical protein
MNKKNLMQVLSENFISAQTSMDATVGDLRIRLRGLVCRLESVLDDLESETVGADISPLVGLSDDASAVERLGRRLSEQQVCIRSAADEALRAGDPRSF